MCLWKSDGKTGQYSSYSEAKTQMWKMCQRKCTAVFFISVLFSLFVLSQSTMVVLQALSEYLINKPPPDDLSLDVDVRIAGRKEIRYHFNPKTAYAARSSRVRNPGQLISGRHWECIMIFLTWCSETQHSSQLSFTTSNSELWRHFRI